MSVCVCECVCMGCVCWFVVLVRVFACLLACCFVCVLLLRNLLCLVASVVWSYTIIFNPCDAARSILGYHKRTRGSPIQFHNSGGNGQKPDKALRLAHLACKAACQDWIPTEDGCLVLHLCICVCEGPLPLHQNKAAQTRHLPQAEVIL